MPQSDKHARTEKPTSKRLKEARDRGQVARSADISSWGGLLVGSTFLPNLISMARGRVLNVFAEAANVMSNPDIGSAEHVLTDGLRAAFYTILPISTLFMVLGVTTNLAQVGRSFSFKAARPKLSRISPKAGVKRLFSAQTSITLGKQFLKLTVLATIAYTSVHSLLSAVPVTVPLGISQSIGLGTGTILGFVRIISLLGLAIGLGDFAYQRHHMMTSLKMTKQEVKDEARNSEGDPVMKNELRKRAYAIARSRIIAATRTADVVVANPTHFSVALQYAPGKSGAPRVVAKGSDALALRMREEAQTCQIPVVEDPPLARYLFANCEIGHPIPIEIYVAVARLLAFVYSLPSYVRSGATLHPQPSVVPVDPGALTTTQSRTISRRRARALQTA